MNKITKEEILEILNTANLENVLLFDSEGKLVESSGFQYDKNFAAMNGVLATMCTEMIAELEYGELQKVMIQASTGLVLLNKVNKDYYIASFTKDISKIGILMKTVDTLINNITPQINK
ncbi:hypothetical protein ACFSX9_06490 [Flavobacterium ardleyense]|uniref:Roadblock/LAMTOR2 domain-containing protein n=1 Tax=Flavobacterium ardleyense TaxID=2038737 RepID=A0ABW5Z7I2_9FLAO